MSLVALSPVSHAGHIYPAGSELPDTLDPARLLRLGVVEERKPPKPPRRTKADPGPGEEG